MFRFLAGRHILDEGATETSEEVNITLPATWLRIVSERVAHLKDGALPWVCWFRATERQEFKRNIETWISRVQR